jgi:hypothetical protein
MNLDELSVGAKSTNVWLPSRIADSVVLSVPHDVDPGFSQVAWPYHLWGWMSIEELEG